MTGLGLSVPERVSFRYFLEGVDHGWSDPTTVREAPYTNLSPGPYRFRVMARNTNGVWSGREAAIEFRVDPLFWQTLWFRASCVIAFLTLLWGLYRYRIHRLAQVFNVRLEERVDERTRIARELHDTLLQSFLGSLIQMQTARNTFSRRPEQAGQTLDDAITMAEGAISESREAIQGLRSGPASPGDLAELLTAAGQDLARTDEAHGRRVSFRVTVEGERRDLDPLFQDEALSAGDLGTRWLESFGQALSFKTLSAVLSAGGSSLMCFPQDSAISAHLTKPTKQAEHDTNNHTRDLTRMVS